MDFVFPSRTPAAAFETADARRLFGLRAPQTALKGAMQTEYRLEPLHLDGVGIEMIADFALWHGLIKLAYYDHTDSQRSISRMSWAI